MLRFGLGLVLAIALLPASAAAEPLVPHFRDTRQQLAVPDTSGIQRLRFLTTTDFFPFNMLDERGNLIGFHVDLARAICRKLELEQQCQVQALPFEELSEALQKGDGEAIIAGIAITGESRSRYDFTQPYFQFPARFAARRDAAMAEPLAESLKGKRVGVLTGTSHEQMLRDLFPGLEIAPFDTERDLVRAAREGDVAAIFADGVRLSFALTDEEAAGCCAFVGGPYYTQEYLGHGLAIATRPDQPLIGQALDYALQHLEAENAFSELYLRYFPLDFYSLSSP